MAGMGNSEQRRQDVAGDSEGAALATVEARISRQKEMDVSIAAKAVFESF